MKALRFTSAILVAAALAMASCAKSSGPEPTPEPAVYTLTLTCEGNGTCKALVDEPASVMAGETVYIVATPEEGNTFTQWVVVEYGLALLPDAKASLASFTMPAANVSIRAEFAEPAEEGVMINGIVWASCNVDAPGTFADRSHSPGMFYQWGKKIGWSAADPMINSSGSAAWSDTPVMLEWSEANDPCPEGWRVPTMNEQATLLDNDMVAKEWVTLPVNGCRFIDKVSGASIFLPAAGNRNSTTDGSMAGNGDGRLDDVGVNGRYWSCTTSTDHSMSLYINNYGANYFYAVRSHGYSVRCVRK